MSKKLTNQIVDDKLVGRNIIRLDNYIDAKTKIRFQCIEDNFIWSATPDSVVRSGSGCPKCSGYFLTNEEIDKHISNKNIIRLDDYAGSKSKIRFRCLIDNFIWETLPYNVLFLTGCAKCSNNLQLTNDIVDQKLIGRNIMRVGNYSKNNVKIAFKCLKDDFIWEATPASVLNIKTGCPNCCINSPVTNEYIDAQLCERKILRLEDYDGALVKIKFKCLKDNFIWSATPNNVINNRTGCPNCNFGKNEKLIDQILKNNDIVFERHKRIKEIIPELDRKIIVDFFLENYNTIVEYNGEQHYSPVCFGGIDIKVAEEKFKKQQNRDLYLQQLCDQYKINLIWIDGRKYTNLKLEQHISEIIESLYDVK